MKHAGKYMEDVIPHFEKGNKESLLCNECGQVYFLKASLTRHNVIETSLSTNMTSSWISLVASVTNCIDLPVNSQSIMDISIQKADMQ